MLSLHKHFQSRRIEVPPEFNYTCIVVTAETSIVYDAIDIENIFHARCSIFALSRFSPSPIRYRPPCSRTTSRDVGNLADRARCLFLFRRSDSQNSKDTDFRFQGVSASTISQTLDLLSPFVSRCSD
jgi:hypothetical protein